jgi:hypothetical protein
MEAISISKLIHFGSGKYQIEKAAAIAVVQINMILRKILWFYDSLTQGFSLGFEMDQLKTNFFHFGPEKGELCGLGGSFADETGL